MLENEKGANIVFGELLKGKYYICKQKNKSLYNNLMKFNKMEINMPFSTKVSVSLFYFVSLYQFGYAQLTDIKWYDVSKMYIEGQAFKNDIATYSRLPHSAKAEVRSEVWELSKNSAGLSIHFNTNSANIIVRYKVSGGYSYPHMPSTGKSGVDLYATDSDGKKHWLRGNYSFNDTITYEFKNIKPHDSYHKKGRSYHLYLPLYNSVQWMEIGIDKNAALTNNTKRSEKPIVVYGTSIAQGACATRAGMAWANILQRKLDWPVINLGFSGNGRLEKEVISFINKIEASVYILDCLPNFYFPKGDTPEMVRERILSSVNQIRKQHPKTPIVLTQHAGYIDGSLQVERKAIYETLNAIAKNAFEELKSKGVEHLYLITKEALNLTLDSFVDGTHPNDLGMQQYANAYEQKIREILNQPVSNKSSTTNPVTQYRDAQMYNWQERHQQILELNKTAPPKTVFIGNSIVHYWGGEPKAPIARDQKSWDILASKHKAHNLGFGWDRIENVLWRVYHGELDGYQAEKIWLMIGTNNLHLNTDTEILEGLKLLVKAIKAKQPQAKLILIGILPRRDEEQRINNLNELMSSQIKNVMYVNIGEVLLQKNHKINETLFTDGLHPHEKGYQKLFKTLNLK